MPGQVLHEIQCDALSRQQRARVAGHEKDGIAVAYGHPVLVLDADRDLSVEQPKRLEAERNSTDDSVLTRHEARAGAPVRHDCRDRRDVVEGTVLDECRADERIQRLARQRKAKRCPAIHGRHGQGRDCSWDRPAIALGKLGSFHRHTSALVAYSPGSTPFGAGDKGCVAPPPIDTMRSIASRARAATSESTVIRCCKNASESRTLGRVVTFM